MLKLKWTAVGVVLVLAGVWSLVFQQATSAQQPIGNPGVALPSGQLVTHFESQTNGPTVLTVVEPQSHVVAVYHIARDTGEVKLKSVRNFDLDLRLGHWNSSGLTPEEIRKMLELRQ
jgi:hypothetical protein